MKRRRGDGLGGERQGDIRVLLKMTGEAPADEETVGDCGAARSDCDLTLNPSEDREGRSPALKSVHETLMNSGKAGFVTSTSRAKKTAPPFYKCISGTRFAVDSFDNEPTKRITHYFLSHYHAGIINERNHAQSHKVTSRHHQFRELGADCPLT